MLQYATHSSFEITMNVKKCSSEDRFSFKTRRAHFVVITALAEHIFLRLRVLSFSLSRSVISFNFDLRFIILLNSVVFKSIYSFEFSVILDENFFHF